MKRFIVKLVLATGMMVLIIVTMHVVVLVRQQSDVDAAYTIKPSQDILFLGSSEFGCSILQHPKYHNRVLWVSDTSVTSELMRLRELDRRGQLSTVKILMVPFNYTVLRAQNHSTDKWAWYQELAVSWRHLDLLPCGKMTFLAYIASNLRWPFHIHVSDSPPSRISLAERPESWRNDFIRTQCVRPRDDFSKRLPVGWESRLYKTYEEMASICKRHAIRAIAVKPPILPQYDACQLPSSFVLRDEWVKRLSVLGFEYCEADCELDEHDFFDTVHLIPSGSKKYTAALYCALLIPVNDEMTSRTTTH